MYYCSITNQYIPMGATFTINDVEYPYAWIQQSTPEMLAELGLELVVATNEPADTKYYFVSEQYDKAALTYINTPKSMDMLKDGFTREIKTATYGILQPTDYIDIRNLRDPSYKPDWVLWRDSVRTYASTITQNISLAEDVDSVKSILDGLAWPKDPNYVAPVESPAGEVVDIPT